jgi:hypothetical protein
MKNTIPFVVYLLFLSACYDFSLNERDADVDANIVTDQNGIATDAGDIANAPEKGWLQCDSASVPVDDPRNCGAFDHDCFALPHVTGSVSCVAKTCVLTAGSCAPGWADCSANPEDGRETDITSGKNCGACGINCSTALAPYCARSAASPPQPTFECRSDCPPATPTLCGSSCVDANTNTNHCGGCGIYCPELTGAQPTCVDGKCGIICKTGFHDCAGKCLSNNSTDSCGDSCTPCKGPLNSVLSCDGTTCSYKCKSEFLECNGECVPDDANNCGKCGHECTNLPHVQGDVA